MSDPPSPRVKICGLTSATNAAACVDEGADAIGINLWPQSRRRATERQAEAILKSVDRQVRVVLVVVDAQRDELERYRRRFGEDVWLQLHGGEPPEAVAAVGPHVLKAFRGEAGVEEVVDRYPVGEILLDAAVPGLAGGTGVTCDWSLASRLAKRRRLWLAGGLRPDNVTDAVRTVRPFGVDVASGVESAPGMKDVTLVRRFLRAVRS